MFDRDVIVRIDGGLGSQLFQYAAGYALAQHLDCNLLLETSYFDRYKDRSYGLSAFNLPQNFKSYRPQWRVRSRRLHTVLAATGLTPYYHYRGRYLHFDRGFFELKAPVYLEGYFLSERYFAAVGEALRNLLTLNKPLSSSGAEIDATIVSCPMSVSIHVRRDDLVRSPHRPPLDLSYFRRAHELVSGLLNQPTYFVFSDEFDYAIQAFDFLPDKIFVRGDSERPWEDMALMSRCRHHITANSSFSWWAAWLNPRPDKIVVAPRHWFTFEDGGSTNELARWNAMDLYPLGWILI